MKIEFLGHSSFLITTAAGTRIVTDPFDPASYAGSMLYRQFGGSADIVTVSHDHRDHNAAALVKGRPVIIHGNGKFAAKEVEFLGVATFHDTAGGAQRGRNTIFIMCVDGLRIAHLGDLGHVLTADQAAEIGAVDVVFTPVGGFYTIDAAAASKVASQLDARIVIPMHYRNAKCTIPPTGVEEFTKDKSNVKRPGGSTLEVTPDTLPQQQEIVVLEPSL